MMNMLAHSIDFSPATVVKMRRPRAAWIVLGLGCLFVFVLATLAFVIVMARRDARLTEAARELRTLNLLLAGETERSFQSVQLVLDGVAAQLAMDGSLSKTSLNSSASSKIVHDSLRARLSGLPQLEAITIVAGDGHIVNYTREWPARYWNLADRSYFKELEKTPGSAPFLSQALVDRFTRQPTIYLARRLNGADGRFLGIIIGAVRLSYFNRFYESLNLSAGEFIALRRHDGELITRFPDITSSQDDPVIGAAEWDRAYGVDGVLEPRDERVEGSKSSRLVASKATVGLGIRVDIGRDRASLLAGWRAEVSIVAGAVTLAALLTATLLWALLRRWHALELATCASLETAQAVLARRDLEEALLQAQKMDAIGQLAGGIAHDFNNMLTVIGGCLEVLRRKIGPSEPSIERCLTNSEEGVRRAAALTGRLLSFARKEQVRLLPIDVNGVIGGLTDLLSRTLGSGVHVATALSPGLWCARGDESQLENAVLNLCVNARDAMPEGGRLSIATANVDLIGGDVRAVELPAGRYVEIAVSDTGIGIPPEVATRIFEPFFTTKGSGKGTGLGLSQVFAFARDTGGGVKVESLKGEGTTFRMYLPRCADRGALLTAND